MERRKRGTFIFPRLRLRIPPHTSVGCTAQASTFALCLQLLTKDPKSRLSSLGDVQSAPYLADMNWDAVWEKALMPGFVPNVSEVLFDGIPPCAGSPTWAGRKTPEAVQWGPCWPWSPEHQRNHVSLRFRVDLYLISEVHTQMPAVVPSGHTVP